MPRVIGVGRMADNERALSLILTDAPSDDDLRAIHEHLRGWGRKPSSAPAMAAAPTRCQHREFSAQVNVTRLTDGDDGPVTGHTTDITVRCIECGLPFRWRGIPFGSSPHHPCLSVDGLELRAPIEPAYTSEIMGMPLVAGTA